jgi:hypothetical protein
MDPTFDNLTPNVTPPPESSAASPEPPSRSSKQRRTIYALQVRAFLGASEEVDIDAETVQDLLEGFSDTLMPGTDTDSEDDEEDVDIDELLEFETEGA